jgi:hypothetical protein
MDLFFINKGINILCSTRKIKNMNFFQMRDLQTDLYFSNDLSEWNLIGPKENIPAHIKSFSNVV